jgi:putative aldouronate transport system permease protein
MVLPVGIGPFFLILMKTYFSSIPDSMDEAAKIDGASEVATLLRIVLPISKPIIGTIGLMAGIAYWNDWTNGLYYILRRTDLYNIQNVLTNMMNNIQFLRTSANIRGNFYSETLMGTK